MAVSILWDTMKLRPASEARKLIRSQTELLALREACRATLSQENTFVRSDYGKPVVT